MLWWIRFVLVMVGVMAAASGLAVAAGHAGLTSDDGLWIVFASPLPDNTTSVNIMKLDGGEPESILRGHFGLTVACSPTDDRIAVVENSSTTSRLLLIDATNLQQETLTEENRGYISQPIWSPDGQLIAYMLNPHWDGKTAFDSEIYFVDISTGIVKRLTDDTQDNYGPFWFPNSHDLAYQVFDSQSKGIHHFISHDLYDRTQVYSFSYGQTLFSPRWSNSGRRIAFSERSGDNNMISVFNIETNDLTSFPQTIGGHLPSWSFEDKWLAFTRHWEDNWDIYIIHPDGSHLRRLTTSLRDEIFPCWLYTQDFPKDN